MTKKLLLSLGVASLSIAPVVAIVSCSSGESVNPDVDNLLKARLSSTGTIDYEGKNAINASDVTLELLKRNSTFKDIDNSYGKMSFEYRNLVKKETSIEFEVRMYLDGPLGEGEGVKKVTGWSSWQKNNHYRI